MNLILETAFNRLLPKYERTFGEQPPFSSASVEEVLSHMRHRLAEEKRVQGEGATSSTLRSRFGFQPPEQFPHRAQHQGAQI